MPQNEILLVSEERLKNYSNISFNVSPDLLIPHVFNAQNTYAVEYLGSALLNEIKLQVRTNTVSVKNAFLLDEFLCNMILQWATYLAIPFLNYKIYNKSIMVPKGTESEKVDLDEIRFLQSQVKQMAQQYSWLMQRYLWNYNSDYPLWSQSFAKQEVVASFGTPFQSNILTPDRPYAFQKRIWESSLSNGSYGYNNIFSTYNGGAGAGLNCPSDFPWWLFNNS
jgi:hypothetical protein